MKNIAAFLLIIALTFSFCPAFAEEKSVFDELTASDISGGSDGVAVNNAGYIGGMSAGKYIYFNNIAFSEAPETLDVYIGVDSVYAGKSIEVHLDGVNGQIIGSFVTQASEWNTPLKHTIPLDVITGVHDVYVVWNGTGNFFKMQFNAKKQNRSGYFDYEDYENNCISYTDINESKYKNEILLMSDLGFADKYQDRKYNPLVPVTRGEFAQVVCRILNLSANTADEVYFDDVSVDNKYSGEISALYSRGIISGGGGSFRPNDFITMNEAVTILVRMLGYDDYAKALGGYPAGYIKTAENINLLKGVTQVTVLRKEDMAKLVSNGLQATFLKINNINAGSIDYDEVKGILSETADIYYSEGTVEANGSTTLYSPAAVVGFDKVMINDTVFSIGDTYANALLGIKCRYFYKINDDDSYTLAAIRPCANFEQLIIEDRDLKIYNDRIEYTLENKKSKKININSKTNIIYNGKALEYTLEETVQAKNVIKVRAVDNGGGYETIFIDEYDNCIVGSVDRDKMIIHDTNTNDNIEIDNGKNSVLIVVDGRIGDFSDLNSGDRLMVYKSKTKSESNLIRIYIQKDKISQTVQQIDDEYAYLKNGDTLLITPDCRKEVYAGLEAEFYINRYNEIIDYTKAAKENEGIGCFLKCTYDLSIKSNSYTSIKLLTEENGINVFDCSLPITVDGELIKTAEQIADNLDSTIYKTPVRFRTNSQGQICMIDTYKAVKNNENDTVVRLTDSVQTMLYNAKTNTMMINGRGVYPLNDETVLISFWNNRPDEEATFASPKASITEKDVPIAELYSIQDKEDIADIIVWKNRESSVLSDLVLVDCINIALNKNDEVVPCLNGYGKGKKVSYFFDYNLYNTNPTMKMLANNLKRGDLVKLDLSLYDNSIANVRLKYVGSGDASISEGEITVAAKLNQDIYESGDVNQKNRYSWGTVISYDNDILKIRLGNGDENPVEYIKTSKAAVNEVSANRKFISGIETNNIFPGDRVFVWFFEEEPKQIILYK